MRSTVLKSLFLIVVFLSPLFNLAFADELDDFIAAQMQQRQIPGLQLAVVQHNKIIRTGSYGLANIEDSVAVDNNTVFSINSMTKAFAGVAIMQLVEQGKLDLSAPIGSYLPELPKAWQQLNTKQIMGHTSGLPAILANDFGKLIVEDDPQASWEKVQTLPMAFDTGSNFKYNQTNYIIVGKLIEKLTGQPFAEVITNQQLKQVGMPRTVEAGFDNLNNVVSHSAKRYTTYYTGELTNIRSEIFSNMLYPAAGMSSTATELANWVIALQTNELLKQQGSLATLWTPARLDNGHPKGFNRLLSGYALGWPIVARNEHPAAAPVGGNRSGLFVYPEDDLAIVVLTNLMGGSPDRFIDDIAGFYVEDMQKQNGFGLPQNIKTFYLVLEKQGYNKASEIAKTLNNQFAESDINNFGYWLVNQNKLQQALAVFELNTQLYPNSANTYDSVAETQWRLGHIQIAIAGYQKVLELQPDNRNAKKQLAKLKQIQSDNI
ncbi:serine hydrolase [Neptunicella marina]|uniref:Serine hydrolase n=2 Tax=Neptunicella marina TaxID=2125989 RepID=A0A8J6M449_9ALTE|nr:serine hydrolase [Neptunicella marina]